MKNVIIDALTGDVTVEQIAICDLSPSPYHSWNGEAWEVDAGGIAAMWDEVRHQRDARLSACDWTQAADAPVDKQAWAGYRQALRDVPQNQPDPFNITWPEQPDDGGQT